MSEATFDADFGKRPEERGLAIAALCKLPLENGFWIVPSQSGGTKRYKVDPFKQTCTCPDHEDNGNKCKHIYAVEFTLRRETARDCSTAEVRALGLAKKPTYKQDWKAYNEAQINEKHRFQVLLKDLCAGIPEPPLPQRGRHPIPLADRLFATCFKVYCTLSSRRFGCDLLDIYEKGHLSRPMHPNKVNCFMDSPALTEALHALIVQSSLPLRSVESTFATDSSGFSVSRFVRWFDEKYGTERSGRDWVKVHIACGVKTNIVTAAAVYERDTNDCPILPELLRKTKKNFDIKDFCADKAYLSADNIKAVLDAGATPLIPFKSNSTGGVGGLFEKMLHYYKFHQEEFLARYHQRSNAESTFSMIKRKFGDNVRSQNDVAMKNEALAKIVCHNICCVIQSQCELGIEPVFWEQERFVKSGASRNRAAAGEDAKSHKVEWDIADEYCWL